MALLLEIMPSWEQEHQLTEILSIYSSKLKKWEEEKKSIGKEETMEENVKWHRREKT